MAIKCWRSSIRQPYVIFGEDKGVIFKLSPNLDIDFWKAYGRELVDLSLADEGNRFVIATLGVCNFWLKVAPCLQHYLGRRCGQFIRP